MIVINPYKKMYQNLYLIRNMINKDVESQKKKIMIIFNPYKKNNKLYNFILFKNKSI